MSHLTKLTTTIRDEKILEITLSDCGLAWTKASLNNESKPTYVIQQSNDVDLLFAWNDGAYSLSTDLQFWQQKSPVELFMDKLHQKYALNMIKSKGNASGFVPVKQTVDATGSIKLTFRKWS
jgi:hypothetical protein